MDAIVTIRYRLPDVCKPEDLENTGMTFEEIIKSILRDEDMIGQEMSMENF